METEQGNANKAKGGRKSGFVSALRFSGNESGQVKALAGFKKGQHTVPDGVNASTHAFLAKLCAQELSEEAETLFQAARTRCAYKRKELELTTGAPCALLNTKDFALQIEYGFDGSDSTRWRKEWSLTGFTELAFLRGEACNDLFAGRFSELVFTLEGAGAQVEAVIDAVEALEEGDLSVDYPSDCSHCVLKVEGLAAEVIFNGRELTMRFGRAGSPAELLEGFMAVKEAFALSKSGPLSGIIV